MCRIILLIVVNLIVFINRFRMICCMCMGLIFMLKLWVYVRLRDNVSFFFFEC